MTLITHDINTYINDIRLNEYIYSYVTENVSIYNINSS